MRDPERIARILGKLRTLWDLHPDQRLGQLIYNLVDRMDYDYLRRTDKVDIFAPDDDLWERAIDRALSTGVLR